MLKLETDVSDSMPIHVFALYLMRSCLSCWDNFANELFKKMFLQRNAGAVNTQWLISAEKVGYNFWL